MEVQFYDEIEFENIQLEVARDVVLYSFIVQKSVTYLDLSACEFTLGQESILTEEQCRKVIEPRRRILYTYHLDLPVKLEHSLRDIVPNEDDEEGCEAFHLGVMFVCESVYTRDLASCMINPILSARNKIEKLRKYLNVIKLLNLSQCMTTAMLLFDNLILVLYPYCLDSNLVVDFAVTLRFGSWCIYRECPIYIGFVLHHAMKIRYSIFQIPELGLDPINASIAFRSPGNICMLLVYGAVLRFHQESYLGIVGRLLGHRIMRRVPRKKVPDRRFFLMLQLMYYFAFNSHYWEGLLYIWRSIPDPCLSKREIRFLFGNAIPPRRLNRMIDYYKFYIVEETDNMDDKVPRPLQHLCRVAVRSALIRNRQLPYGIGMLGKPRLIREYLNLKC